MTFRRVLRSSALPAPAGALPEEALSEGAGRLAVTASATTVGEPTIRKARVGRARVLLTRLPGGGVVAFAPRCPHEGTSLADASIYEGRLRCPRHNYLYDPVSGENVLPAGDARPEALSRLKPGYLRTYPVREEGGWVWVSDVPNPPPPAYDPDLEAGMSPRPRGASSAGPAEPETELTESDEPAAAPPRTVTATVGTEVELALPTRPLPAHFWQVDVSGAAVALVDETMDSRSTVRVRLSAQEPGEATVRCAYAQPWAEQPKEEHTITVHVRG